MLSSDAPRERCRVILDLECRISDAREAELGLRAARNSEQTPGGVLGILAVSPTRVGQSR